MIGLRKTESLLSAQIARWKLQQMDLAARRVEAPLPVLPRFVAGADVAFSPDGHDVLAAAVVFDRDAGRIVEIAHARRPAEFPYVPGYLSFREGPTLLEAIGQLRTPWEVILCDGQGIAHPRRCGLAVHISVLLDKPGVGVAKSRLIGTYEEPGSAAGSFVPLMDAGEQIGIVLRTRDGVRPLFVSVGHRMNLESARQLVLACCRGYRLPEPTRQADIEVARLKGSLR